MTDRPDKPERRPDDGPEPLWPIEDVQPLEPEPEPLYDLPEPEPLYAEGDLMPEPASLEMPAAGPARRPVESPAYAGPVATRGAVSASRRLRANAAREMGQLWGSVFFAVDRPAPKAVVVTAATRGEGATQIAAALAIAGASGHDELRVALVDANLRHPRVHTLLDVAESPGLSDVLMGRATLEQALQPLSFGDGGGQLCVLPSGAIDGQPLGLMRGRQFKSLLGQLRERFDHVVIDTAAANVYPDPQIIGALADGVLLVVHASKTRRETVAEAKRRLELARAKVAGVVLNQRTYPIPGFLYRSL